ncbi:Polyadenylate-binding protein 1-A [Hibiscus syriacus]|uniref:Polyadenylate-binding protein 1-A n=1 Tax=Hibiscus syriacus TaxID=106335 RepID=A0A6A3BQN4_HIBSY|nr:Polyadenylate-binding protein 1-A [Hibiscus syriacus]
MASSRPPSSSSFRSLPPPRPQPASTVSVGGWNPRQRTSLYVGDLDPNVTEDDLYEKFSAVARVVSIRLCRCIQTGKSLCYAYVNFYSNHHASTAFCRLNHTDLKGKPVRIMWSQRDPFPRKVGLANLFVKNLDPSVTTTCLEGIFCRFGNILSCKIAEENGKSKGFGFVQFASEESALSAITALHDTMLKGKKLYVSKFVRKCERTPAEEEKFTNLYVKNLFDDMTEDSLKEMFSKYGMISSVVIMKDDKGVSRGFGFVNFQSPDDAKKALEAMNGVQLGSKNLFVGRAQMKAERTKLLKNKYKDVFDCRFEKSKASNLYVKNLKVTIDDKRLQELFGLFGRITSARVMRLENGTSKGFGFVCFSSPEEAMAALHGLNGALFEGKFLYVAVAQRKEDRRKELQNYYVQNTAVQSSYQSSCNGTTPQYRPIYFNFCPSPTVTPHLFQPSLYQHPFVANVGSNETNEPEHRWGQKRLHTVTYNSNVRIRDLDLINSGNKKVGFRKREPTVIQLASPGNSNISHPFEGNLKPKHGTKVPGQPLEMNSDVMKLLNSPNSLAVEEKPVQVLKEENARTSTITSTDAATLDNLKSVCCLGY